MPIDYVTKQMIKDVGFLIAQQENLLMKRISLLKYLAFLFYVICFLYYFIISDNHTVLFITFMR